MSPEGRSTIPPPRTISLCMIVRNEEERLPACLASARSLVDEIVVVDTGSTDGTVAIALEHGAKIVHSPWQDDFSLARNASLKEATGDWILILDADEELMVEDRGRWQATLADASRAGFLVELENLRDGESPTRSLVMRVFRNHPTVRFRGLLHERVDDTLDEVALREGWTLGQLPARIVHHGYTESARRDRGKDERNRRLLERVLREEGSDPYLLYKIAVHPLNWGQDIDLVRECLARAWEIIDALPEERCRRLLYAPEVAALLALELDRDGRREIALGLLEKATRACNESPNLAYAHAVLLQGAGRHEEAIASFRSALEFAGRTLAYAAIEGVTSLLSVRGLSESLHALGRDDEARETWRASDAVGDPPFHGFFSAPDAMTPPGELARAFRLVTSRVRRIPEDAEAWERGRILLRLLGKEEAIALWERRRAASQGPEHPPALSS